jgi:hypothetical protein
MASTNQQQRHWYNDREMFLHGFVRSNYITSFTDWFMGLAGKATEIVLYATVLYSCAQLYPGVSLPTGLSLAVFLVQMGALDIGGLSLGKLAKQAREDGNVAGSLNAEKLSKWLIGIMLVGVVVVGLQHALPVALPSWVIVSIDVLLVIARSICAVLYGRVVHDLKQEMARMMPVADVQATIEQLTEHLQRVEAGNVQRIERAVNQFNARLQMVQSEVVQQVQTLVQSLVSEPAQVVQSTFSEQFTGQLAEMVQQFKREMHTALADARTSGASRSGERQRGSSPARSLRPGPALRRIMPPGQTEPGTEQGAEPVHIRVPRFIQEQVNQGRKPSLSEIMNQCQCSKNTAIRYRREIVGAEEEERSA